MCANTHICTHKHTHTYTYIHTGYIEALIFFKYMHTSTDTILVLGLLCMEV